VRGRDEPHVYRDRRIAADALDGALLQHAQQHDLNVGGKLGNLIEEEGAAMRQLESATRRRVAPVNAPARARTARWR